MNRRSKLSRCATIGCIVLGLGTARVFAGDVTIITHGWNPTGSAPAWMASLRDDISSNFLAGAQNYGTITVTKPAGTLVATCSPWNVSLSPGTNGDILIVLDWSAVANHLTGGPTAQDVAAVVIDKLVTGQNGQQPLAELPIHLIGHSRGGGMVCELARLLGERGVVVDHLTPLDPHPLTASDPQPSFPLPNVIDTPAAIYQNVVFADVYYQTASNPVGQYLTGAYNRQWTTAMTGGYHNNTAPNDTYADHRNILLMYQGSVNLANPLSNGEAAMGATERTAWFNAYENSGDNTGFSYSRLDGGGDRTSTNKPVAGGDAIRGGLNSAPVLGGGGARSNLAWNSAAWPNIAQLDVLTNGTVLGSGAYQIIAGSTQQLRYIYLDYDSGCTVTLRADADRNPYNSNDVAAIATQVFASATGGTYTPFTNNWNTGAMTNGTTAYVYAQVTDGTRTRYFYAAPALQFAAPAAPPVPVVAITNPPGDVSVGNAVTAITVSGTNNAAVVGTQWWTNTLAATGGTFAAASPWTVASVPLAVGTNTLRVYGTNAIGALANAMVTVTRSAPSPAPVVAITNPPGDVSVGNAVTTITVSGTNNAAVVGTQWWTNTLAATGGTFAATSPWTVAGMPLAVGTNLITVFGTNAVGVPASGRVTITRLAMHYVWTNSPTPMPPYTNWATAAHTIQEAVNAAASGETVLVTNGVYAAGSTATPGGALKNRVCITDAITVQSVNGPSNTFVVGAGPQGTGAVRCVYMSAGVLAGFTLTNGNTRASGSWITDESGGGVMLNNGGTVSNCLLTGCSGYGGGGGAFCYYGGTLNNCTLKGNTSSGSSDGGGGAFCYSGGTLNNCTLKGNQSLKSAAGGGIGGGAYCMYGGTLNNCTLNGNSADDDGGGAYLFSGGMLNNCTLSGNSTAGGGGGAGCENGGTLNNCTLDGNKSDNHGGGANCYSGGTLNNCTLSGNTNTMSGGYGGGVWCNNGGTLENCIVYGNTPGGTTNIYLDGSGYAVRYTCSPGLSGSGNITNDPKFVNAAAGNFRLLSTSPCANTGTNEAWMTGATDLDGNPRISAWTVDMGAYEYVFPTPPGNALSFNGTNAYVNIPDANSLDLTTNYTMECWFKADSFGSGGGALNLRGLIGKYQTAGSSGYLLRLNLKELDFDQMVTSGLNLQAGQWYHVAAVNSNGTRHLYVNGVEKTITGTATVVVANTNEVRLGCDYRSRYFAGQMDEARVWNVARSEAEIRDAMHKQLTGSEPGLVACYNFNISSGTLLPDLTTNGNDGTLVNGPVWTNSTFPCANAIAGRTNLRGAWIAQANPPAASILCISNAVVTGTCFRVFGHDSGTLTNNTSDKPAALAWRLNRAWQVEGIGALTGSLVFDCAGITNLIQNPARLRLLADSDGAFTNASPVPGTYAANLFTIAGQSVPTGGYYTVGEQATRTITATAGPHGTINPGGAIIVTYGDSTNFAFTPDTYWHVGNVTTNDASVGAVSSFIWSNVVADGTIDATFAANLAAQGTPHWWLAQYGLTNSAWTFDQAETNHSDSDTVNNGQEYIADTNPTNPASYFHVTTISTVPPWTIYFPSSTGRTYTLNGSSDLASGVWTNIPGQGPRHGVGGPDQMIDTNAAPLWFYRPKAALPE